MWKYLITLLFAVMALVWRMPMAQSQAEQNANPKIANSIIDDSFERGFDFVKLHNLDAPEASRIYVLLSMTLQKSWNIESAKPLKDSGFTQEAVEALLNLESIKLDSAHEFRNFRTKSKAEILAFSISSQIPKPKVYKTEFSGAWKPEFIPPVSPNWKFSKPIVLETASQYRPKGPPSPETLEYRQAINEVKTYGGEFSQVRGSENAMTARLWMGAAGSVTSPGHWNRIAISQTRHLETTERLKVLTTLNIAMYDAGIAAWDVKYHFQSARPSAVINSQSSKPQWQPMAANPNHPEYVSGHSTFSAAGATILSAKLGDRPFCVIFEDAWNIERCYISFWQAAEEAGQSRIYGGLHFDFSNRDGLALGQDVAKGVLRSQGEFRDGLK